MDREQSAVQSVELDPPTAERSDPDPLRHVPEGELWTFAVADAFSVLDKAIEWRRSTYPRISRAIRRERRSGALTTGGYRARQEYLKREEQKRQAQIRSCAWFFFSGDSMLEFICEVLDYPVQLIRDQAGERLRELHEELGFEISLEDSDP